MILPYHHPNQQNLDISQEPICHHQISCNISHIIKVQPPQPVKKTLKEGDDETREVIAIALMLQQQKKQEVKSQKDRQENKGKQSKKKVSKMNQKTFARTEKLLY